MVSRSDFRSCLNSRKLSKSRREIRFTFRRFGPDSRNASRMATKNSKPANGKSDVADGFRISVGPVIRLAEDEQNSVVRDFGDVVELPRLPGPPMLFAIARDPHAMFT